MPTPRRCSAPPSTGRTSRSRALPTSTRRGNGRRAFVHWYNHEHRHSGIRYVTPAQRHAGEDQPRAGRPPRAVPAGTRGQPAPLERADPQLDAGRRRHPQSRARHASSGGTSARTSFPVRPASLLSRPDLAVPTATARNEGDGRSGATRSHAQRMREHGEDGEHRTFTAASTVAASHAVGADARPPKPG